MQDQYLWLENVLGEEALLWVREQNAKSIPAIKSGGLLESIALKFEEILSNKDKIAFASSIKNNKIYNFWNDEKNLQGLWRRASVESYVNGAPLWETLLDFDELSRKEGQKWVFNGADFSADLSRAMLYLSPGGTDADYAREFDLEKKQFVEGGFALPLSKGNASWLNNDELLVARDFGSGTLTAAGYAKTIRRWKRGDDLALAPVIFEIESTDNSVGSDLLSNAQGFETIIVRNIDFYQAEYYFYKNNEVKKINLPKQMSFWMLHKEGFVIQIATDWRGYHQGDCLYYCPGNDQIELIWKSDERSAIYSAGMLKDGPLMVVDCDVTGRLLHFFKENDQWKSVEIKLPKNGTIDQLVTDECGDDFFVGHSSFNSPLTYYYGKKDQIIKNIKSMPSYFAHEQIEVQQLFVKSADGTKVPYFLVHQKGMKYDGKNPTILYGYGGFEISLKPNFSNLIGSGWLERGGVYVLSNIRGGGEYGPRWHQSALKENRERAYEDFFAIAEDLIARKITSSEHLGAQGGSNGGLLMGVCYTKRPDLFKAIDCGVPLLDMQRYHKLLAGFSWVAEYGNPDDDKDGRYIRELSPYHNIKKDEKNYPVMFLHTSTKDDRVHPGHARKFAAKLLEYGHTYFYHENIDGGHAGASNFKELAFMKALDYAFFWQHLK